MYYLPILMRTQYDICYMVITKTNIIDIPIIISSYVVMFTCEVQGTT